MVPVAPSSSTRINLPRLAVEQQVVRRLGDASLFSRLGVVQHAFQIFNGVCHANYRFRWTLSHDITAQFIRDRYYEGIDPAINTKTKIIYWLDFNNLLVISIQYNFQAIAKT